MFSVTENTQPTCSTISDNIIYANPIKANETLVELDRYKPLVTFDNHEEIIKIRQYAPHSGLALRLRVPNTGAIALF